MIRVLAGIVGVPEKGEQLTRELEAGLARIREASRSWPQRPRVYFEEWDDPLISGIHWVEELVEIAGGAPIFPELARAGLAKDRIVDPAEVIRRDPEIVLATVTVPTRVEEPEEEVEEELEEGVEGELPEGEAAPEAEGEAPAAAEEAAGEPGSAEEG